MTDREALQIAWNALTAIDANTPYPVAKHALWAINQAFNTRQEECNTHPDASTGMTLKQGETDGQ